MKLNQDDRTALWLVPFIIVTAMLLAWAASAYSQTDLSTNQQRTITVSNVTYTINYALKSTKFYMVPLTIPPGQPHYACMATVFVGTNKVGVLETEWTENGCYEDSPMMVVGRSLGWTRFPNNSAGPGRHWRISGAAMYTEED
jgi:hypothetical protein